MADAKREMQTITRLPEPSKKHATCAWCRTDFDTIVELIDHVDAGHRAANSDSHDGHVRRAA